MSFLTTTTLSLVFAYEYDEEKFNLDLAKLNTKESYEGSVHKIWIKSEMI
jgi:hypothetical protein